MRIKIRNKTTGEILDENSYRYDALFVSVAEPHTLCTISEDEDEEGNWHDYSSEQEDLEVVE